jgi:hypothetical protein
MRSRYCTLWLLSILISLGVEISASTQRYTASATTPIKRSKPTPDETDAATIAVKKALLAKVIAEQDASRRQKLQSVSPQLNPDDFFVAGTLLISDTQVDKERKCLTLVAQVDADSAAFNKVLDVGSSPVAPSAAKQWIAWVFAARRQSSVKEYDPEVFNRVTKLDTSEKQAATASASGVTDTKESTTVQNSVASSGGVLRKADAIDYVLAEDQRARIDKALSSVLVNRGFSPVPSSDLQANSAGKLKVVQIMEDYRTSSDLSDDSKALVMEAALRSEVDFFATGTVTLNAKTRDPATGNTRIGATLDAQIYGFRKSRNGDRYIGTTIVASTGSRVVIAIGKDQTEAENKAIEEASILAANVLCDQLRAHSEK